MNSLKWTALLLTLAGLGGCAHNVREANGLSVGQHLQTRRELAIQQCQIFSSELSFWTELSPSLCLSKLRADIGAPPRIGVLSIGARLKIVQITEVNAIDWQDTVIHLRDEDSGTKYFVQLLGGDSPGEALREALER